MQKIIKKVARPPKLEHKKKVAAYARVSSGKDAMLHSLSAQVSYYKALIQDEPTWQYVGVFADEAITGTKEARPGFQEMLSACRAGRIDMIITKSISRFSRNTVTLLEAVRDLKALGVDIYFEEQNIHSMSSDGELLLSILASFAQEESRSASENQKWRIKKNFEEGVPWNSCMLGYRLKDGCYRVVPEEAKIVQRIYAEYLEGAGPNLIAKRLTADGIPTENGGIWQPQTVWCILRNSAYSGDLLLQLTYRENHITKRKIKNTGQYPQYLVEDAHEAIIPKETFNAVQAEIARRFQLHPAVPPAKPSYPFTGLLVCSKCGRKFRRKTTRGKVTWICATYKTRGKQYCASKEVPESTLEDVTDKVTDDISDILKIEVDDGNVLRYYLKDGRVVAQTWADRSRSESWTPEMKAKARRKTLERNANYGKSN